MAERYTGADAVQAYLTGATATNAGQPRHRLSLGGYRSSVRVPGVSFRRLGAMPNLEILHASGLCGRGVGSLVAIEDNVLAWYPPGATDPGASVSIGVGEIKLLHGPAGHRDKTLLVRRSYPGAIRGSEYIQTFYAYNNVWAGTNFTADGNKYSSVILKNLASGQVTSFKVWIDPEFYTDIQIASEALTADAIQTIASETTAPTGLSWVAPTTQGAGLDMGTLNTGDAVGLWIEREVDAGYAASGRETVRLLYAYTLGGTEYTGAFPGLFRIGDSAIEGYVIWISESGDPDMSAAPDEFSTTLDYELTYTPPTDGTVYLRAAYRNAHGIIGAPLDLAQRTYASGELLLQPPAGPMNAGYIATAEGKFLIYANYLRELDNSPNKATGYRIYARYDGTDPDPATDSPVDEGDISEFTNVLIEYTTEVSQLEDTPARFLVTMKHDLYEDEVLIETAESENRTAIGGTAKWWGPLRPPVLATYGARDAQHIEPEAGPDGTVTWIDQPNNVYWESYPGQLRLWAGTTLCFNLRWFDGAPELSGLFTTFGYKKVDVSGSMAATDEPVEILSWTGGDKRIGFGVNGDRLMVVDVTNQRIEFSGLNKVTAPETTRANVPVWPKYAATCFQVWDDSVSDYKTIMSLMTDGSLRTLVGLAKKATEAECLI
ncbi:MAG: hypothetical protein AMXMBFR84_37900 [Candidatus Hydrogenedentota bacterium]